MLDTTYLLFVVTVTQGKAYLPLSLRTSVRLGMGGFCTRRGGCNTISPLVSIANQCRCLRHCLLSWLTNLPQIPDYTGIFSRVDCSGGCKTRNVEKGLSRGTGHQHFQHLCKSDRLGNTAKGSRQGYLTSLSLPSPI